MRSGNYLYLTLPGGLPELAALRTDQRKNPLYRAGFTRFASSVTLTLPQRTAEILLMPGDLRWDAPAGMGTVRLESHELPVTDGARRQIRITRAVDLNPAVISTADYPSLLEINRRLQHPELRTILLRLD